MADYGHDLKFGSFLTPQNRNPEAVVDLAVLSEDAGLDLATFQDHPYQANFLDAWTLLSWSAARTRSIHLAAGVTNLPLRPPAVLARSVASLDLLSGGRIDLGLGAGAFWDAIEAMGGRKLKPGESIRALSEAIDIIRGIWDAGERTPLRVKGDFYTVDGAKRGPAPAHDVPIWLGAYKPRILRLVGEKADGWLPSMSYLSSPTLCEGNQIIDDAAREHGRDPREIRRLLNVSGTFGTSAGFLQGSPAQWVEQLLPLVLEDGVSTFVLGSDDPMALQTFGQEVAPALRDVVAAERARTGTDTSRVRPAAFLAARHEDIDYDAVPAPLAEQSVEPGDRGYEGVRSTYIWDGSPGLVLRPGDDAEVAEALAFARKQDVPLAVRSGGHGISGRATNDGGIVIDLGRLNGVEVIDRERRLVRLGAGARWGEVAEALAPYKLAISSGDYGDVGVGGLATTGGLGFLARSYGLTIDHVKGAAVVLADGRTVHTDADHHPELFWALRGAGGNMGIVTSFDIEAAELDNVVFATFAHDAGDMAGFLERWGELVESSPRELTAFLTVGQQQRRYVAHTYAVWANDDTERAVDALEPFLGLAPVLQQQAQLIPYAAIMTPAHNEHHGDSRMHSRSALVEHIDSHTASVVAGMFRDHETSFFQIRAVGGAVNDTPAEATAYAHRAKNFALSATLRSRPSTGWDNLAADALYLSFETHDQAASLPLAFPAKTLERLREVKASYDPDNIFRNNFPIVPAEV